MSRRVRARRTVPSLVGVAIVIAIGARMTAAYRRLDHPVDHRSSAAGGTGQRVACAGRGPLDRRRDFGSGLVPPAATTRPRVLDDDPAGRPDQPACPGHARRGASTSSASPSSTHRVRPLPGLSATRSGRGWRSRRYPRRRTAVRGRAWSRYRSSRGRQGKRARRLRLSGSRCGLAGSPGSPPADRVAVQRPSPSTTSPTRPWTSTQPRLRIGASSGQGRGRRPTRTPWRSGQPKPRSTSTGCSCSRRRPGIPCWRGPETSRVQSRQRRGHCTTPGRHPGDGLHGRRQRVSRRHTREYEQCYGPSWGRHRDRTRPVPGNHEYQTPGAAGYKAYFGRLAMPSGTTWYAYDLGPGEFTCWTPSVSTWAAAGRLGAGTLAGR